jgi:hypothetical protein
MASRNLWRHGGRAMHRGAALRKGLGDRGQPPGQSPAPVHPGTGDGALAVPGTNHTAGSPLPMGAETRTLPGAGSTRKRQPCSSPGTVQPPAGTTA